MSKLSIFFLTWTYIENKIDSVLFGNWKKTLSAKNAKKNKSEYNIIIEREMKEKKFSKNNNPINENKNKKKSWRIGNVLGSSSSTSSMSFFFYIF